MITAKICRELARKKVFMTLKDYEYKLEEEILINARGGIYLAYIDVPLDIAEYLTPRMEKRGFEVEIIQDIFDDKNFSFVVHWNERK